MPFFKPAKLYKTDCVFLQVLQSVNKKIGKVNRKRVCLFTSNGGISIEAAIALSVFIMMILFVESYLMFINTEFSVQMKINNVVKETSKNMFYASVVDDITSDNKKLRDLKEEEVYIKESIKEGYMKARLFQEIGSNSSNYFLCGLAGINTTESSIQDGEVDLVATYKMEVPFVNKYITITQRGKMRGWQGADLLQSQELVYITESGKVYHTSKECSHLNIKISKVSFMECKGMKNNSGEKYVKCGICIIKKPSEYSSVFVTKDGNRYHSNLNCSGIKRKIITLSKSKVEDMPMCSRCGEESNDN